jgi:pimeloyl-ACP methyl ester carboxylesterase
MTPQEIRAAVSLAAGAVVGTTTHVERMHSAIAGWPLRLTGTAGAPIGLIHDAVVRGVYASVRAGERVAGAAVGEVLAARARGRDGAPVGATPRGNFALAALNAAVGDRLAERRSPLGIRMALRVSGRDVPADREELSVAFPGATARLAVFVHGLGGTEDTWLFAARRHYEDPAVCYGSKLADEFGYTALYVRYNTGLHVSENGRLFSDLLGAVVANWPTAVAEIALIGHSMGGLIARSACHGGQQAGASWVPAVRHVVCLGSPHLGAPLEKGVAELSRALAGLAETRPVASLLNERSAGIKDLRHGYVTEDDWRDCDPDTCRLDHRSPIELLPNANHYAVAATVTRDPSHPIGRAVGDVLVLPASAHGVSTDGRQIPFPAENRRQFGGLHHLHLLNHPDIYQAIRHWLAPQPN